MSPQQYSISLFKGVYRIKVCWLVFLCCVCGVAQLAGAESSRADKGNHCQVVTVEGKVTVHLAGSDRWLVAKPGQSLQPGDQLQTGAESRATVQFSDLSVFRVNELTLFGILPPSQQNKKPLLDLKGGSLYFFSREKPAEIQFQTPTAAGAIRGTEFNLQTTEDQTSLALIDGEVQLGNEAGQIVLKAGELGQVTRGQAPVKSPFINAVNIIQWCLYYPAVVDLNDLPLTVDERQKLILSLDAYSNGDLLTALERFRTNQLPASAGLVIYEAALEISVGKVDRTVELLKGIDESSKPARALREMVAAVQGKSLDLKTAPASASEWLAHSYYLQSKAKPVEALSAAYSAVALSPSFGFAWVRIAELELGLERLPKSRAAIRKGIDISPRNAQAFTVQGFLWAAQDHMTEALSCFNQAIELDGGLGNAWLGRGLCRIRKGDREEGRKDMQIAATLEPQRALLRSYLAKAFENEGLDKLAQKDLRMAKQLDPNDPTAWLYSALLNDELNRINEAVEDLEKSKELNDNQSLFRSKLLLDQDQAVREADLALIYADDGMQDVAVREAAKAVNNDYGNYSAHLFLANSYELLRDPTGYNQRFDAASASEWLIANLLAPVGSQSLSRNVAAREYSPFFVTDGVGFGSSTAFASRGLWAESASQFGRVGNMAYSVDASYITDPGQGPNRDIEYQQYSAQTKVQVSEKDSVFLFVQYFHAQGGDTSPQYDPVASAPIRMTDVQDPDLFLGWHREWQPGSHTLFLAGRIEDQFRFSSLYWPVFVDGDQDGGWLKGYISPFNQEYKKSEETYFGELQQIMETEKHTFILGGRVQAGNEHGYSVLDGLPNIPWPVSYSYFKEDVTCDLQRAGIYGYDRWRLFDPLQLTLGMAYEGTKYPVNLDLPPLNNETAMKYQLEPKLGLIYTPWKGGDVRFHYTRSLTGEDIGDSYRLEPTLVGGINQTYRSVFPEAIAGSMPVSELQTWGAAVDQTFSGTGTYLSLETQLLKGHADRIDGVFTNSEWMGGVPDSPSSARHVMDYQERALSFNVDQLLGREWSFGINDRISQGEFTGTFPGLIPNSQDFEAILNQVSLSANYNHPCGAFAQFQSLWLTQNNLADTLGMEDENFWQHNIYVGYRFPRRHAEIRAGILNLWDQDYRLSPVSLYSELPRTRTLVASLKIYF